MSKVALVIGASSGIGEKVANLLISEHYIVYNGSRRKTKNEHIINLTVDVANDETIKKAIRIVWEKERRLDLFIYCAGFSMATPLEHVDFDDVFYLFQVNVFGMMIFMKYIIPLMKIQGGGQIIGVSSMGGILPIPYDSYYSSAKAALNLFLLTQAIELKRFSIGVSSVMPGGVRTDFTFKRKEYWIDINKYPDFNDAVMALSDIEQNGMKPLKVARKIMKIVGIKNPPLILPIGIKNKMTYCLASLIPKRLLLKLIRKKYHLI